MKDELIITSIRIMDQLQQELNEYEMQAYLILLMKNYSPFKLSPENLKSMFPND